MLLAYACTPWCTHCVGPASRELQLPPARPPAPQALQDPHLHQQRPPASNPEHCLPAARQQDEVLAQHCRQLAPCRHGTTPPRHAVPPSTLVAIQKGDSPTPALVSAVQLVQPAGPALCLGSVSWLWRPLQIHGPGDRLSPSCQVAQDSS
eukprot:357272-Chlamydomonas_euryale.AAC.9